MRKNCPSPWTRTKKPGLESRERGPTEEEPRPISNVERWARSRPLLEEETVYMVVIETQRHDIHIKFKSYNIELLRELIV